MSKLFEFKTIEDEHKNEFVVFKGSMLDSLQNITDKTEFEASENHIHLLDNVKDYEFESLTHIAQSLGMAVLCCLHSNYPQKHFRVYVSVQLGDSMIIRFHQIWDGEEPYYNPDEFTSPKEKVYAFIN